LPILSCSFIVYSALACSGRERHLVRNLYVDFMLQAERTLHLI